jgi:hypothetical protein
MSRRKKNHLDAIVEKKFLEEHPHTSSVNTAVMSLPPCTTDDYAASIAQRKMDSLNCYLRTVCMRLADEITMPSD